MSEKINKSDAKWMEELTSEEFHVCRKKGTERPFTGKYWNHQEEGVYKCLCCGTPLFSSEAKFDSGSGWPSFWAPIAEQKIVTQEDHSHSMHRVEVLCDRCGAHLGHVFDDGPEPTGMRYCINSASLKFEKHE